MLTLFVLALFLTAGTGAPLLSFASLADASSSSTAQLDEGPAVASHAGASSSATPSNVRIDTAPDADADSSASPADERLDAAHDGATSQADVGMDLLVDPDPAPSQATSPMPVAKREEDGVATGLFAAPPTAAADSAPVTIEPLDETVQNAIRSTDNAAPSPSHEPRYRPDSSRPYHNTGLGTVHPYQFVDSNAYYHWYQTHVHPPLHPAPGGGGAGTGQQGGGPGASTNRPPVEDQGQQGNGMHPPNPETSEWHEGAIG